MGRQIRYAILVLIGMLIIKQGNAVCNASFEFTEQSPLLVNFINLSTSLNEGQEHYYWDFGNGSTSFEENPQHLYAAPGIYNVNLTIITTNLCTSQKNIKINVGIPATSPHCYLEIEFETLNATAPNYNNGAARVFGYSDVPCCYYAFWSNGMEGEIIYNLEPGTYCVTLTNGEECYGSSCVTIGYNNNCHASFLVDSTSFSHLDGAYRFVNNSHGEEDYYLWDFGDGSESDVVNPLHVYADTGTYEVCLTIRTHYDCTATYCKSLYVNYITPMISNLYGTVRAGAALLPQGLAILFEFTDNRYSAVKITAIENGLYQFDSLPKDLSYLSQAIPIFDVDEVYFPKYSAAYNNNAVRWQNSELINLFIDTSYNSLLHQYNDIYFNQGRVSGFVYFTDTTAYEKHIYQNELFGDLNYSDGLAANMIVFLMTEFKEVMDFRLTDENGFYEFKDLNFGTYYISVEKPGFYCDDILVELTEDLQLSDGNNFTINQTSISKLENYDNIITNIFPNPASDYIIFNNYNNCSDYEIIDLQGKLILFGELTQDQNHIKLSQMESGIYVLRLSGVNGNSSIKLIVSR